MVRTFLHGRAKPRRVRLMSRRGFAFPRSLASLGEGLTCSGFGPGCNGADCGQNPMGYRAAPQRGGVAVARPSLMRCRLLLAGKASAGGHTRCWRVWGGWPLPRCIGVSIEVVADVGARGFVMSRRAPRRLYRLWPSRHRLHLDLLSDCDFRGREVPKQVANAVLWKTWLMSQSAPNLCLLRTRGEKWNW